jgi:hypothetical protein
MNLVLPLRSWKPSTITMNRITIGACESWVDWSRAVACDKDNLVRLVNEKLENISNNSSAMYVLCSLLELILISKSF